MTGLHPEPREPYMMPSLRRSNIICFLLLLALCGALLGNAWESGTDHSVLTVHIESADSALTDMDDIKHKLPTILAPVITTDPYTLSLPTPAYRILVHTPVLLAQPTPYHTRSTPSRASPV